MKVLMLSTDQKIFDVDSAVRQRIIDYGKLFEELHVIIYTKKELGIKNYESRIAENVFLYPTLSRFKLRYFWDAYKLGKSIMDNNFVITSQDPFETALVGYCLKVKFKMPLQIQSHSDFLSPYFWKESLKNKARVLLGRWLIKKADGIRVVSERVKHSLVNILRVPASKIVVLPIIFDLDSIRQYPIKTDLRKKYSQHSFIILVASRLSIEKNIGLVVGAMVEVVKNNPKALLLIVGSGPERENLESRIKNYELGNSVVIESWTDDLISYYKTADLFVLTSNYEGGARSPIEAMAAGLPVVMTDVPPAGETVIDGKNGFVVPVGDSKALAEKIGLLIKNPDIGRRFREELGKTADHFPSKDEYLKRYQATFIDPLSKNTL